MTSALDRLAAVLPDHHQALQALIALGQSDAANASALAQAQAELAAAKTELAATDAKVDEVSTYIQQATQAMNAELTTRETASAVAAAGVAAAAPSPAES